MIRKFALKLLISIKKMYHKDIPRPVTSKNLSGVPFIVIIIPRDCSSKNNCMGHK
jgi:hypothetical protein